MLKQEPTLPSHSADASAHAVVKATDELQHIKISVCELGPELFQRFRAANPNWRPQPTVRNDGEHDKHKSCPSCLQNLHGKSALVTNAQQHVSKPQVDTSSQIRLARPLSISFGKPPSSSNNGDKPTLTMDSSMPLIHVSQSQEIGNPIMIKASHPRASGGEDMTIMKFSVHRAKAVSERENHTVTVSDNPEHDGKHVAREEHAVGRSPQLIMKQTDAIESLKSSELALVPSVRIEAAQKHSVSSEELVQDSPPRMDKNTSNFMMKPSPSQAESSGVNRSPKYQVPPLRVDEPILVDDQDLFDYIVATRKIPDGVSLANLEPAMQRKLQLHYKNYCPPCPHCNSNTYVKFRYFNNSGKSSLLQPRYTCRNPDTCLTVQEKTGKAGSRDFTLPRPRDADNYGPKLPAGYGGSPRVTNLQAKPVVRQPQMIARLGSKRPAHDLNSPSETFERSPKLPNTTLSLQSLNGSAVGMDVSGNKNISRVGETSKSRSLAKPVEDSHSSSSTTQTASEEQMDIDIKCQAATSPENGRLVVQPISVQTMAPPTQTVESGALDRSKGKIAEVNICMYIDLSNTSPCR